MTTEPGKLGKRLKSKRIQAGLTLRELSVLVGVSFSGIARIERGIGTPTPDTLRRISEWLDSGKEAGPKPAKARGWFITFEQRLAAIEDRLGIKLEQP